ncbi:DNA translocase FtsK [Hymenobacter perfusus]|uniref:FtsK gamma domain-containing protein n=1 Tax=Hymenobacter perfusus TaxID=1236770 RepID=A0A3R9MKI9_9BACT|nr:DNA translocase FtsK [Hymenobacter perfusus]RSK44471.1 hypothetical protein EI293_08090 [Hymenobacter perfusus]
MTSPDPPTSPAQLATALLAEWEQRAGFRPPAAHRQTRPALLARLTDCCRVLAVTADVNLDIDDFRAALLPYSSLRLGRAQASGNGPALRLAQAALADAGQWLLGPAPTTPARHVLLIIESHPTAELEMDELTAITEHIQQTAGDSRTEVVFGHGLRPNLPAQLRLHLLLSYGPPLLPLPLLPQRLPCPALRPEEIFPAAVRLITAHQTVSSSLLQRQLGLGYNRTSRLLEELVKAGVIRRREDGGYGVVIN